MVYVIGIRDIIHIETKKRKYMIMKKTHTHRPCVHSFKITSVIHIVCVLAACVLLGGCGAGDTPSFTAQGMAAVQELEYEEALDLLPERVRKARTGG